MATKPDKSAWNPNAADRTEPTGSKKLTGWLPDERPPSQFFNWFWYIQSLWENFLAPAVRHNVIISTDADEGDYATIQEYIADAPVAGDRVLITKNQTIAAQVIIPNDITITIQDGVKFISAIDLANSLIKFGSNVIVEGNLILELTHTGTVDSAIELNGNSTIMSASISNTSTGTLTIGILLNAAKQANSVIAEIFNTGAGTVTTVLNDLSIDESNFIHVRDTINGIIDRSLGALSFLNGFTFDLGSDADGDIYYRDAGILKRLAKGTDGQTLELVSGLPSWENTPLLSPRDSFRNLISENNSTNPNFQIDISFDEGFLQDGAGNAHRLGAFNETIDITNTITSVLNGLEETQTNTGTYSTVGTAVTGVGTLFTTEYQVGDALRSDTKGESRVVTAIASDLAMTIGSAFTTDVGAGETAKRGGEVADAHYYKWLVSNETNDRIMLSTRYHFDLQPVLPAGFTFKAFVGAVRNDSSSDFVQFKQFNNKGYSEEVQVLNAGSAIGTPTFVNCDIILSPAMTSFTGSKLGDQVNYNIADNIFIYAGDGVTELGSQRIYGQGDNDIMSSYELPVGFDSGNRGFWYDIVDGTISGNNSRRN
jgi:hypothetical protein